jgi:hypothetical protein
MTDTLDRGAAEERFRAVFSHLGSVTAYARRRGSRDADAIAAEAMTIAWRRLADVPHDDPKLHIQANTVTAPGAGGGHAVMAGMWAWEDYWVRAIRTGDSAAQQQARDELLMLLDDHVVIAPSDAS